MAARVLGLLMFVLTIGVARGAGTSVEVVNNHPFAIHQPVELKGVQVDPSVGQQVGNDAIVLANAGAGQSAPVSSAEARDPVKVEPVDGGVRVHHKGADLGVLSWDVIVQKVEKEQKEYISTKRNFDESFKPMPLKFEKSGEGPLFENWSASGEKDGTQLNVELRAYRSGFLDATVAIANKTSPVKNVYAAVICRWQQTSVGRHSVNYNNQVISLNDAGFTPFRAGTERHLYVMRGADWINSQLGTSSVAWLNDFTPSFTVHKDAAGKQPARWLGANTAQLGQEAQLSGNNLYSITEIARPNIKGYRSRLDDNVLPQPGNDPLKITSRLIFSTSAMTDEQVDQAFIAMTSFRHQDKIDAGTRLTLGVPFTRFGTAYFPYSTFGENFINLRIPGMSKEGYWPLAAETVNRWELFTDDIKRDLRILKAMGFELDRLHHLELLWDKDPGTKKPFVDEIKRREYLDFYFTELKHLGLKALLDVKLSPEETADLVQRYREQIEGVEIDNEVILFMIPDNDVQYWKDVYAAVKRVAPEMPVHLTGHTNTGAFNRLMKLGVPFDLVGAHAYLDALEAIPSSRDYALAVADYASEQNKEPVITEWNWRFLTRMPFEERAKVYPPIFENVLETKSMPTVYQFQFQDSLAMNPALLKGMRRYELLLLSRRPKPEAFEFMKLIQKYGSPNHPNRLLDIPILDVEADADGNAQLNFTVTCKVDKIMKLNALLEAPEGVKAETDRSSITLGQTGTWMVPTKVSLGKDAKPGFYHVFLRIEGPEGITRYGWAIIRKSGAPELAGKSDQPSKVTYEEGALQFDLNRPITVVYGKDCPPMELESAWTIFITLESATGRVVEIAQDDQPAAHVDNHAKIIVKSTRGEKPSVKKQGDDELLVTGDKSEDVATAAMDLVLKYWMNAKDSAVRRLGVTAHPSGKGGFQTDLE
ncbi:MAG TPA: hypothetical protein VF669_16760 [Tepidisphaeraceae bacterium]